MGIKYDLEIAKILTNIEDEKLLNFYINAVIKKIEGILGYELLKGQITSLVSGLNKTMYSYLERKLKRVLNAKRGCKKLPFQLCK